MYDELLGALILECSHHLLGRLNRIITVHVELLILDPVVEHLSLGVRVCHILLSGAWRHVAVALAE